MEYRADLHSHTICSDGTLSPTEILYLAKESRLSALSITDHDTLDAYTDETLALAKKLDIDLFPGVELSAHLAKVSLHILGYGMNNKEALLPFFLKCKESREQRNEEMIKKLSALSLVLTQKELEEKKTGKIGGRVHIAQVMVEKGYVKTMSEAFDRYIGDGRCCFVQRNVFSVEEIVDLIHQAGGKAFIAHPHLIKKKGVVESLLSMNFDGIECYYSNFPLQEEREWLEIAHKKNLLISGGSDFHGAVKPQIKLGCSWVDRQKVRLIFQEK